jgi:hypothetical protein
MAPPLSESSADVVYGVAVEDDAHGYGGFGVVGLSSKLDARVRGIGRHPRSCWGISSTVISSSVGTIPAVVHHGLGPFGLIQQGAGAASNLNAVDVAVIRQDGFYQLGAQGAVGVAHGSTVLLMG